jgi:hypothetical protein
MTGTADLPGAAVEAARECYRDLVNGAGIARDDMACILTAALPHLSSQRELREALALLTEARDKGLIYWEPNTRRGEERKAEMLDRIDAAIDGLSTALAASPAPERTVGFDTGISDETKEQLAGIDANIRNAARQMKDVLVGSGERTVDAQIKHMVDRFLVWRLPANFSPDGGISFEREYNQNTPFPAVHEPVGTNLFSAEQATEMVRFMLDGLPQVSAAALSGERTVGVKALEWVGLNGSWSAETPFGSYEIIRYGKSWAVYLDRDLVADPDSETTAKAAAQADFEQRIRSALTAQSEPAPPAVPDGCLSVGHQVTKTTGYPFPGEVRAVFKTRAGLVRYVIEATGEDYAGMLHIFSPGQLAALRQPATITNAERDAG